MKSFSDFIVDTKRLKNNAYNIKSKLDRNVKLCAIVKANAYGMGVETVCKSLYGIVDFFAVSSVFEAINIRVFDKITPIIVLGVTEIDNLIICAGNNISVSVSNLEKLTQITSFCEKQKIHLNIHIQVNTGLNRYGFRSIAIFRETLKILRNSNYVQLQGVYSHFATKDNDIGFIKKQFVRFGQFKKYVKDDNVIFHIANSYATLYDKKFHLDMVRNGFLLYGGTKNNIGNKFILTIKSKLANVSEIKKGDTIGYDRTFVAKKNMIVGVVPIGYADGYDRRLSNKFYVLINGEKCPIVGNICMDCFMVDITKISAKVGDVVVLLGSQKGNEITLFDIAKVLDISPYEVLLKFNYRRMNYIIKN